MDPPSTQPIFPRLSSGPRKMDAEAVARHQRGRLQGAMVEAVSRHGYESTTLRELVSLAGVSKSTFYENFESKEDCFLATFDTIIDQGQRLAGEKLEGSGDLRARLLAGLRVFLELAAREEAAAKLVVVDSLTLGAAAVPHRERAASHFEALVRAAYSQSPSERPPSDLAVRGVVAGIRNALYQHLRAGRTEELPRVAEDLAHWVLSYNSPPGPAARRAAGAASVPHPPRQPPRQPGDGRRERICRAAAELTVEKGYAGLSIPAISTAAGVSNQTFYEHFPGKREALLGGFDLLAADTLATVSDAYRTQPALPEAIGAGLRALLDHIVAEELFARLAFFELPMAGQGGLDQADRALSGFSAFLEPATGPWPDAPELPPVVKEAIVGGGWATIQHEIASGRADVLPARAPEIAEFAATPFDHA